MIKNRWDENESKAFQSLLEQRVYTSRLLGQDASLVLHGGGNTSVKAEVTNLHGEKEAVLYVKGSGWDLASIEAPGFPAVKMDHLLKLRALDSLSDPDMVNELRTHLVDSQSPNPSVEALLHAFLPHRFVDHTHANAVLTLGNQPDGEKLIKQVYGSRVGIVPYIPPGFELAKVCADIYEQNPRVEGLVLIHHGIFSFGDTAKESYDRMIQLVQTAEEYIQSKLPPLPKATTRAPDFKTAQWLQKIRQSFVSRGFRPLLSLNQSDTALRFVNHPECKRFSQQGPITPDHVIRTKRLPLYFESKVIEQDSFPALDESLEHYETAYNTYFESNCQEKRVKKEKLDSLPRVLLLPQIGIVTIGSTFKAARIAADIYEHTASVILNAESVGKYIALSDSELFDMEYWVLEQAKLKLGPKKAPLTGKTAIVTGGASGIGLATAKLFLEQGACVSIWDIDASRFESLSTALKPLCRSGNHVSFQKVDISDRENVKNSTEQMVRTYGGIDILISNAGIFPSSSLLEDIEPSLWKKSLDVNLTGSLHGVAEALKWMKQQDGGDIIFIASKNVLAPGKKAGAYSIAKAGQNQLARVCALEAASHGIRVNTLHPNQIFDTGIWNDTVLTERAAAYGLSVEAYKKNNLLKTELSSQDVAKAAFALVGGYFSKTTGAQIPVDGGSDRTL